MATKINSTQPQHQPQPRGRGRPPKVRTPEEEEAKKKKLWSELEYTRETVIEKKSPNLEKNYKQIKTEYIVCGRKES